MEGIFDVNQPMQLAIVFQLVPAFAFFLCLGSLSYLWLMRSKKSGVFVAVYALNSLDFIMSLSLFYCAFHGTTVISNTDYNSAIRPVRCYLAIHISVWVVLDVASALVLLILCIDQIVSIIWTKTHKNICQFYMQPVFMGIIFLFSFGILRPAWDYAIDNSENNTVTVSSFCTMYEAFGEDFYDIELTIRIIAPFICLSLLILAAFLLLFYQISQEWNFKWSENNDESVRIFYFALIRVILNGLAINLPIWLFLKSKLDGPEEICLRMIYAGVIGLIQPIFLLKLFPDYWCETKKLFCKYSQNTKRNWQSAGDPPVSVNTSKEVVGLDFGSWYSSGGNIVGECGIPYEMDADKQRSISFYHK